jgi:hypothetical protein
MTEGGEDLTIQLSRQYSTGQTDMPISCGRLFSCERAVVRRGQSAGERERERERRENEIHGSSGFEMVYISCPRPPLCRLLTEGCLMRGGNMSL